MAERQKIAANFPDTVRRLNFLAERLGVANYLEIGLGYGGTFDNVEVKNKVGVDPHPWNPGLRGMEGIQILTSDEYFTRNFLNPTKFDLILLDGLHTAEQTYRDFVNSLSFAHRETVWLIDDIMPCDVFSAIPDQPEAIKLRKAGSGSEETAWHGDVYKVVWMIRTFHSNMTLRSFQKGQPQALVYFAGAKSGADMRLPDIANLSYIDTLKRRAEYNLGDDKEILEECVAAITKRRGK